MLPKKKNDSKDGNVQLFGDIWVFKYFVKKMYWYRERKKNGGICLIQRKQTKDGGLGKSHEEVSLVL